MTLTPAHRSAKPSHYDDDAKDYDAFQEEYLAPLNRLIEQLLRKYRAHSVLDMTCGTGSQALWLADKGFDATGSDFNAKMLRVAKKKAKARGLNVPFVLGDIRTTKLGTYDAVISMSNAIGHLTKADFGKALQNIYSNLKPRGLFVFDIFDLEYLSAADNIAKLTIDWLQPSGKGTRRVIQYSTVSPDGILASHTTSIVASAGKQRSVSHSSQTLQIYSAAQLHEMLRKNGFDVIEQITLDNHFRQRRSPERILTIAQRRDQL
jgi:2-polyprenyl-3-methyl-5-hydroxy-6-metoxy-1,4-benzoquinol methylase